MSVDTTFRRRFLASFEGYHPYKLKSALLKERRLRVQSLPNGKTLPTTLEELDHVIECHRAIATSLFGAYGECEVLNIDISHTPDDNHRAIAVRTYSADLKEVDYGISDSADPVTHGLPDEILLAGIDLAINWVEEVGQDEDGDPIYAHVYTGVMPWREDFDNAVRVSALRRGDFQWWSFERGILFVPYLGGIDIFTRDRAHQVEVIDLLSGFKPLRVKEDAPLFPNDEHGEG